MGSWCSFFFFSSRRRHTRFKCDWSSDVCSSDLPVASELMRMSLESTAAASGNAAIMIMLSTLVGGLGDVGLYFASLIVLQMLGAVGQFKQLAWLERAATELQGVLGPQL